MKRIVEPEILDDLAPDDPAAIRSRRDLRLVNKVMGGPSWILKQVSRMQDVRKIVELGAGDGQLSNKLKSQLPDCEVTALDMIPRPHTVRDDVVWKQVNVLDYESYDEHTVVVANLFIHHLQDADLKVLGGKLSRARAVVLAEPHRQKASIFRGKLLFPIINHVTRHDMVVSIKAGFLEGEIVDLLGSDFNWSESYGMLDGIRMLGERR